MKDTIRQTVEMRLASLNREADQYRLQIADQEQRLSELEGFLARVESAIDDLTDFLRTGEA